MGGKDVKVKQRKVTSVPKSEANKGCYGGPITHVPTDPTLSIIFELQALQFPNDPAVIFEDKHISYQELNLRSNAVAHMISDRIGEHRKPDAIVALCLDRTDLMVIAILGVWKAGCAYVAIDPKYPPERVKFILEDTKASPMLTDNVNLSLSESFMDKERILNLSTVDDTESKGSPPSFVGTQPHHLSHIVYTSGTTGTPKGVMITREALITESFDYRLRYRIKPGDPEVILYFLNYVFNAATVPLLLALSNAYPLLIVRPALLFQTEELYEYLRCHGVTHIDGTPSLLRRIDLSRIPSLRRVAIGGETLTLETFNHFVKSAPGISVFNIFGNSEGTMGVMHSRVETEEKVNVLRNVSTNKRCYILTETNDQVTTIGEIGELGIAGAGVARGYLNNDLLTQDRFIPNPFRTEEDKRDGLVPTLYKTGDLFRVTRTGVEFVGRVDHQVKIRGIRVELGEIETVIRSLPNVSGAVVIAQNVEKSEEAVLIGYFEMKTSESKSATEKEMLGTLRTLLPDYMVPFRLVQLDELPLTSNGKIDRNSLPPPPPLATTGVDLPQDPAILLLSSIWADVLSLTEEERIGLGVRYDFFEAGGNSLLALRLVERVNEEFGISIEAVHLYNHSTIQRLSDNLPNS